MNNTEMPVLYVEAVNQVAPSHWRILLSFWDPDIRGNRAMCVANTHVIPMMRTETGSRLLLPGTELLSPVKYFGSHSHHTLTLVQKNHPTHNIPTVDHLFLSPQETPWRGEEAV